MIDEDGIITTIINDSNIDSALTVDSWSRGGIDHDNADFLVSRTSLAYMEAVSILVSDDIYVVIRKQ